MSAPRKVALVTGSTSGIGLATAQALAKRGVDVIITGSGKKDEALINSILDEIKSKYAVQANYIPVDMKKTAELDSFCSLVDQLYPDGIDILVNNAGFNRVYVLEEFPDELWDEMIAVMLTAPFLLTKRYLPAMKKKGWGRIVNMSSQMGLVSSPGKAVYSTIKHGLIGFTKGVALETASHGITCNAVCPGFTRTAGVLRQLEERAKRENVTVEEIEATLAQSMPTKTLIAVEQVAELVEFLCLSNASAQMTGATYLIDQGFTAQ